MESYCLNQFVIERLHRYWKNFAENLNADRSSIPIVWEWIFSAYTEPHRFYNNLINIDELLYELDSYLYDISSKSFQAIEFAIWFQNIVYDTQDLFKSKEESIKLAKNALGVLKIKDSNFVNLVCKLISSSYCLLYIKDLSKEEQIIVDIYLKYLANYDFYFTSKQIKKEYEWMSTKQYHQSRIGFYKKLCAQDQIFHTKNFRKYEKLARNNIEKYIKENG